MTTYPRRNFLHLIGCAAAGAALPLEASFAGAAARGRGAVVCAEAEAGKGAAAILRAGGNAVDAAVSAVMTLSVTLPASVGIGGYGGSLLLYLAREKRVIAIDFDTRAPVEFKPALYRDRRHAENGYLAATAPGVLAGLGFVHGRYGKLPWRKLPEQAIEAAERGIPVQESLEKQFARMKPHADKITMRALFPDGKIPSRGEKWRQKDLAATLRRIAEHGYRDLYTGETAEKIIRQVRANGGILTMKDFANCEAQETEALTIDYRGVQVYTPAVPSAGIVSFAIMKTLENFDIRAMTPWGAPYFHSFALASKLCWQERFELLGDPDFVKVPTAELISAERAKARAKRIRRGDVPHEVAPDDPEKSTVNVLTIDGEGNVVSLTATHGGEFGAKVAIESLGLMLGHGMARFTYDPKSPNYPEPGKRMQHNMAPMLLMRDERPWCAIGTPGGRTIVSRTAQLAINVIDYDTTAEAALRAPHIHTEGNEPLDVYRTSPAVRRELEALGHALREENDATRPPNIALIDRSTGRITAACGAGPAGVKIL